MFCEAFIFLLCNIRIYRNILLYNIMIKKIIAVPVSNTTRVAIINIIYLGNSCIFLLTSSASCRASSTVFWPARTSCRALP